VQSIGRPIRLVGLILATLTLAACGNGTLDVNVTDTPADNATSVIIAFSGVILHDTTGKTTTITFSSPEQIDLMQLANGGAAALLQGQSVPAASYDWMQLEVLADENTQGQSSITLTTGEQYPLYIPSGSGTGLTLNTGFKVSDGQTTQLNIEFDLRQSITGPDSKGQNYLLVPALRLENQDQLGAVTATVDLSTLATQQLGASAQAPQCSGGLFVFSGSAVTPQNGGGSSLVDFEPIPYTGETTQFSISFPYLEAGTYTLAATCNYNLYNPAAVPGQSGYQTLHWTVQDNVSVTAGDTTTETLPGPKTSNIVN